MNSEGWQIAIGASQTLVAVVTAALAYRALKHLRVAEGQLREMQRATKATALNAAADSINGLNQVLITDKRLLRLNGESALQVLCDLKLNRFEQFFLLYDSGAMDDQSWRATEEWIKHSFSKPGMHMAWKESQKFYQKRFVEKIDGILKSEVQP